MVYIASDHRGFDLKSKIVTYLNSTGVKVQDLGPFFLNQLDDYSDYAIPLAQKISQNPNDKGIIICKNGVGVSIVANRYKNVRAALSWNRQHAESSRMDDDTNVLALPANFISEAAALEIIETWLSTPFGNEDRHIRRLAKIQSLS